MYVSNENVLPSHALQMYRRPLVSSSKILVSYLLLPNLCEWTGGCAEQLMLWQTFAQQAGQAQASKTFEDVEVEGTVLSSL